MGSASADLRRRVGRGLDLLEARFGRPEQGRRLRPLDALILTILSQNTNDRNSDRAYSSLRRTFPTWERVARARRSRVEAAIRTGGLAKTKSRAIQDVLRRIADQRGAFDLDFLRTVPADEARRYLEQFRGVGHKTICCVLLFSCGHAAFPVDTHILRIARRLGWIAADASPARAHEELARLLPAARYYPAHINLIMLGREICRPGNPDCPACPLRRSCRHAARAKRGVSKTDRAASRLRSASAR
jgi:endonuclease-3